MGRGFGNGGHRAGNSGGSRHGNSKSNGSFSATLLAVPGNEYVSPFEVLPWLHGETPAFVDTLASILSLPCFANLTHPIQWLFINSGVTVRVSGV